MAVMTEQDGLTRRLRWARQQAGSIMDVYEWMRAEADNPGDAPSLGTLNRWIAGQPPNALHLALFCRATGVSADYILGLTDDPYR